MLSQQDGVPFESKKVTEKPHDVDVFGCLTVTTFGGSGDQLEFMGITQLLVCVLNALRFLIHVGFEFPISKKTSRQWKMYIFKTSD